MLSRVPCTSIIILVVLISIFRYFIKWKIKNDFPSNKSKAWPLFYFLQCTVLIPDRLIGGTIMHSLVDSSTYALITVIFYHPANFGLYNTPWTLKKTYDILKLLKSRPITSLQSNYGIFLILSHGPWRPNILWQMFCPIIEAQAHDDFTYGKWHGTVKPFTHYAIAYDKYLVLLLKPCQWRYNVCQILFDSLLKQTHVIIAKGVVCSNAGTFQNI